MDTTINSSIKYFTVMRIEPYSDFERVKIYYIKNGIDQNCIFMDYSREGIDWKMVEEQYKAHNKLRKAEVRRISEILNENYNKEK